MLNKTRSGLSLSENDCFRTDGSSTDNNFVLLARTVCIRVPECSGVFVEGV